MAAAARCMRSLIRNPSNINASSRSILRSLTGSTSARTVSSISLKSSLKEVGLFNGGNYSLISKGNLMNLRPVTTLCNLSAIPLMSIESTEGTGDAVDGTVGDDDGESWPQNNEEGYIGDDT